MKYDNFLKSPVFLFLIKLLGLYVLWYFAYSLWLHPGRTIDVFVVKNTLSLSKKILELLGYQLFTNGDRMIGIIGTSGLMMGDNCNGISLFALFSVFIIAFSGPVIRKVVFIFFRNNNYLSAQCYPRNFACCY